MISKESVADFIGYAERRERLRYRKEINATPWTLDPILREYKFCNVFRDDDRTAVEARAVIMELPEDQRLRALFGFRFYNRVSTLTSMRDCGFSPEAFLTLPGAVFNTLAYKINLKGGLFNRAAVVTVLARAEACANAYKPLPWLHDTVDMLQQLLRVGEFLALQTALDLRWLYGPYADEHQWCAFGPGGVRGLARLRGEYRPRPSDASHRFHYHRHDYDPKKKHPGLDRVAYVREELLPAFREKFPRGTLSDVHSCLCEYDKYERIRTGEGTSRRYVAREAV